jgi:hypothetical protein
MPRTRCVSEAGNLAFIMAKETGKVVGRAIRVVNATHLPVIHTTDNRTDKEDALKLARLITDRPDSRLPLVSIPGDKETERRKIPGPTGGRSGVGIGVSTSRTPYLRVRR